MPYAKPVFVCQDMPITFQQANLAQQNLQECWLQLTLRHGWEEPLQFPPVPGFPGGGASINPPRLTRRYGQHNDVRIPRVVVRVQGAAIGSTFASVVGASGEPGILGAPVRLSTGVFDFPVLGLFEFYGEATPFGTSAGAQRLVTSTSVFPAQGRAVLRFELYQQDSGGVGAFLPAEFDFTAAVYGAP
jgi:hypothetical protein